MKHIVWLLIGILPACGAGCGASPARENTSGGAGETPGYFIAAEWNVQALFDGTETGNEYDEYTVSSGWTAEKYRARITAASQAILQMIKPGAADTAQSGALTAKVPDLIGFVELENETVLEDLARGELSKYGYFWNAFAAIPGSSLGIGILSRFPLTDVRAHSITVENETAPRPVLEVRLEPRGKPLVFLLCHWKSKLGNAEHTEALRRSSARVVQRRLGEIREAEEGTPVIVMGDLNENHDEFYLRSGKVFCALLPDDPDAAALAAGRNGAAMPGKGALRSKPEFLVLSGRKPPRSLAFPDTVNALYSPWGEEMEGGTYYYKEKWETIDNMLLSDRLFDGADWDYSFCRALNHAPFVTEAGVPNVYMPHNGRGLSDHLPLLLVLKDLRSD